MTAAGALYPRLLGPAWETLDPAVRRAHSVDGRLEGWGRFRIWCAPRWPARALCALVRLPPPGEDVETRLTILAERGRERWLRRFGDRPLASEERAASDGTLVERVPGFELRFRLEPCEGALHFRQVGAALRLGPLRLPLPRWLAPQVSSREAPAGGGALHVEVAVRAPLLGPIFGYEGTFRPGEESP